jgi:hypothetical protein
MPVNANPKASVITSAQPRLVATIQTYDEHIAAPQTNSPLPPCRVQIANRFFISGVRNSRVHKSAYKPIVAGALSQLEAHARKAGIGQRQQQTRQTASLLIKL